MSANTTVYVRVLKTYEEWVQVQAVTLWDAERIAREMPEVVCVLETSYEPKEVVA